MWVQAPWWGLHHMMFFSKEVYIKSQLNIILLRRPLGATHCCSNLYDHIYKVPSYYCIMSRHLGATRCCSSLYDHIYKVPAHYCIMTWPLGAILVIVFNVYKAITSPRLLQAWQPDTWGIYIWNTQFWLVIEMNKPGFLQTCDIHIEANLKLLLRYLLKTWGIQVIGI